MKTDLTKQLETALWAYTHNIGIYGCDEVQIGSGPKKEIVDFITYEEAKNIFRCYEIKTSKSDLKSDSALSFVGDYNYIVVPEELVKDAEDYIFKKYGIMVGILVYKRSHIYSHKKATRRTCSGDMKAVLKWSMFRSLARNTQKIFREQRKAGI